MAKVHIEGGTRRPEAIRYYLDVASLGDFSDTEDVMNEVFHRYGFPSEGSVNTEKIGTFLSRFGIVEDDDRQSLTDTGDQLLRVLLEDETLFYELLSLHIATYFHSHPSEDTLPSWTYYKTIEYLLENRPVKVQETSTAKTVVSHLSAEAEQRNTDDLLENVGALSNKTFRNFVHFIKPLEPSVLDDGVFTGRTRVKTDVFAMALDKAYQSEFVQPTTDYGDLITISPGSPGNEFLRTVCGIQRSYVVEIAEQAGRMYEEIECTSDFEVKVRIREELSYDQFS